jgi:predicted Zn-dependent protease
MKNIITRAEIAQKIRKLENGLLFTNLSGCIHLDDQCSYNTSEIQFWIEEGRIMKIVNNKNCHN